MSSLYGESADAARPLPNLNDPISAPFWRATREHRLELQRCGACGFVVWPAAGRCPECLSEDLEWTASGGAGRLWSWATYTEALHPAFAPDVPYIVAVVELDDGPTFTSNLVNAVAEDLHVGMPVQVAFDDLTPQVTLAKFRPSPPDERNTRDHP